MAAKLSKDSKILIVGAGTWGCSTALHLARRGYKNITVLDSHPVPSAISAGNDVNKIADLASPASGDDPDSVNQAALAAATQGWLNDPVFSPYYHDTGLVVAASSPEGMHHVLTNEIGNQSSEFTPLKTAQDFRNTMPTGVLTGEFPNWQGFFKPRGSGWVHARKALTSTYNEATRLGVRFITGGPQGEVASFIFANGDISGVQTSDGTVHEAARYILSAGASSTRFIDFENQIRPTGWTLGHIQMSKEEAKLYKDLPVLFNVERGFFMEPDEDRQELKMCDEHPGYCNWVNPPGLSTPISVPFAKHQVPLTSEQRMRRYLREVMPHLADRPLVHARLCWCADTLDRQFLITAHPSYPSLVVATGDCGRGFMHIPSIGGFISDCVEGNLETRFAHQWRWRPETVKKFWGNDPLDRFGAENKMLDLQKEAAKGWTNIGIQGSQL